MKENSPESEKDRFVPAAVATCGGVAKETVVAPATLLPLVDDAFGSRLRLATLKAKVEVRERIWPGVL